MMTAASTIRPKSIAPRLIRFAEMPKYCMPMMAHSIASGIADETIRPARSCSRNRNRTAITTTPPSIRFFTAV